MNAALVYAALVGVGGFIGLIQEAKSSTDLLHTSQDPIPLLDHFRLAVGLEIEPKNGLGIRRPEIEPPVRVSDPQAVELGDGGRS